MLVVSRLERPGRPMLNQPFDDLQWAKLVTTLAELVELPVPEACRAGVVTNLRLIASFAALVTAADLDADDQPAPVFIAGPQS